MTIKEWQIKSIPHNIISEYQHQSSPVKTSKEWQVNTELTVVCGVVYTFSKHHVFSQVSTLAKHHITLSQAASRKTSCVCVSASAKTSSHKTVSRKTSHDTTEAPGKTEIPTSCVNKVSVVLFNTHSISAGTSTTSHLLLYKWVSI